MPDDHHVDVGDVVEELQPERAMAGHDRGVIERVHERETALVPNALQCPERVADVIALEDDLGAVPSARLDFRGVRVGRHHDGHRDAGLRAGPGVGLPGVAGGHRDRAAPPLVGIERRDPVRHPARLERAGLLEMLRLDVETIVGEPWPAGGDDLPRGGHARQDRRAMNAPGDPLSRSKDVRKGDGEADLGHAASIAAGLSSDAPRVRLHLRVCATSDMIIGMLGTPVRTSTEMDRQRYAAVGRALADPKRLCVLESLAGGRALGRRSVDQGRLPGPQHEPAPCRPPQRRPRPEPA